jgi:neutral/alkaline ceramidase-like enzyme
MQITHSYTRCRFGVATRDVTPPVGIYARSWGAATHDTAEGVHRPFAAGAAVFAPIAGDGPALALVAVDLGWFQYLPDERDLRAAILDRTGLEDAALLINMSHTHSGANVNSQLTDKPGSELIQPYLDHLTEQIGAAILEARAALAPAWVTYGTGRCALAANRDLWDAAEERFAAGYNPDAPADDTLLVAKVTGEEGNLRATLFNYACHPTTLAWQNRLLSPDYIGAAREVLDAAFGVPALFLQGASGELAPRDDYVGDTAVADRNGRQLGYAAAAAIESLPPPGTRFVYTGIVASGANLGTWEYQPCEPEQLHASEQLAARVSHVDLQRKEDIGVVDSLSSATPDSVQEQEKALRRRFLGEALGDSPVYAMPVWTWRLGGALLVAVPNEPYSVFQLELRRRFAGTPLLVLGVTNRTMGYLSPAETYGTGLYQEQQSPFAPGCLEQTIEVAAGALDELRQQARWSG